MNGIDATDRAIIAATQGGLPVVRRPFAEVGDGLHLGEADVIARLSHLQTAGVVRRVAAAPDHYRLGMVANGMTVWDVEDARVSALGAEIGALAFVTHCYLRPRAPPSWPYNLFAMVHGATRAEVEAKRAEIASLLGPSCRASEILYSTRILKKAGLRLRRSGG